MLADPKRWLEPPHFAADEDQTNRARIANTLTLYLGAALLITLFILIPFFAVQKIASWILTGAMFSGLVAGRHLISRGRFRAGSTVIVLVIYLCILAMLVLSGGSSGPAMFYLASTVLIAGFFLDARVVDGLAILTFLVAMGISFLQNWGLVLPQLFKVDSLFSWLATGLGLLFMIRARDIFVGSLAGSLALARSEIAMRRQVEAALGESEERYKLMFESAPLAINITRGTEITYANPSYLKMFGYSSLAELKGLAPLGLFSPEWQPKILENIQRRAKGLPTPSYYEAECIRKDGSRFQVLMYLNRAIFVDGPATVAYILDMTERKRAEEALRESEARYKSLFENNHAIMLIADPERATILDANPAACAYYGWSREELQNKRLDEVNMLTDAEIRREMERARAAEGNHFFFKHRRADGSIRDVEVYSGPLVMAGRSLLYSIVHDITERKQRETELQAIATLSAAMRTAPNRAEMLPMIADQLVALLDCETVSIEIVDPLTGDAVTEVARGDWTSLIGNRQKSGTGINAIISQTRKPYSTNDLSNDPNLAYPESIHSVIRGGVGVPLIAQDQLIGFVWMGRRTEISEAEVRLLVAVADITANAIHRATLHEQTQQDAATLARAYDTTLEGWAHALELRDQDTEGHTRRVVQMTLDLARALGIAEAELENIRRGALLHDIGKMGIPDSVLLKPGTLNEREWEIMYRHPEYAFKLLEPIEYLHPAADIPYCHHEKWDGTGYPRGLCGEQIPLVARIFAIVDVWDALLSDRPYRKAWSTEQALKHIREQSGRHFDPQVVKAFLQIL